MSKRETQLKHYLRRTGSYATRGTKGGVNLLGWEEPENMTPEQERAALVSRIKQITGLLAAPELEGWQRRKLGALQAELCRRVNKIRPKIRFRGLEAFFCDVVREELGVAKYKLLMMDAKHRWARWMQEEETRVSQPQAEERIAA